MTGFKGIYIKDDTTGAKATVNNGALDVNVADRESQSISLFLAQTLAEDLTIRTNSTLDDTTLLITSATVVPVVGNYVCIKEGTRFSQVRITSVANPSGTNYDIGIAMPIDFAYTTSANICLQNCNMNVNGSVTPIDFIVSPQYLDAGVDWHITRMIISMTHTAVGDDGLFGGITALTNGVFFRIQDGVNYNLYNARENADFAVEGFDVVYSARSGPGGAYGTRSRISFNGEDKRGVVIPLHASDSDKFLAKVRDNLSTLTSFKIKIQGHVVD